MLLLGVRDWRRLAGVGIPGVKLLKVPGPDVGCCTIEGEEDE